MKRILKVILITICCATQLQLASAQTAEVTQLLLNVEKLAQFKQILKDMKKGYDVVSKGYGTIKDISEGNFSLHKTFLDGLYAVNPNIAKYRKVADIIRNQGYIISEYKSAYKRFIAGGRFNPKEIDYLAKVYSNLFNQGLKNLGELTMVLTANQMRMSDQERLTAIDRIYEDTLAKLGFLRGFNNRTLQVDQARLKQLQSLNTLKEMNGFKP